MCTRCPDHCCWGSSGAGGIQASQLWAYYNRESPYNTVNVRTGKFDGIFNLTMTPLRSSDVMTLYGYYRKDKYRANNLPDFREKTRFIVWIASHCHKERDVCRCDTHASFSYSCLQEVWSQISTGSQYVTEKYWNTVNRGSNPIVYRVLTMTKNLLCRIGLSTWMISKS